MFSSLLTVAFAITVTILLLGLGVLVGYQLGLRARAAPIMVVGSEAKAIRSTQSVELCLDAAEAVERRASSVADIAKKYRETMPPELTMAIDQLVAVATRLSRQLQQASSAT